MDNEELNETKSKLDILWKDVIEFRNGDNFKRIMDACAHFKQLAPYNAMLVYMQRPGAEYVLTAQQWRSLYDRRTKLDARPMLILVPFGPVDYVFDIGDTLPSDNPYSPHKETDQAILNKMAEPYKTQGEMPRRTLQLFIDNLAYNGIAFNGDFQTGADYAAKIEYSPNRISDVSIYLGKYRTIDWRPPYQISIKGKSSYSQMFTSLCHELGHLFCHHLRMPADWKEKPWEVRYLDHKWKEFEAESVAWLVCERLGIENPSAEYLAKYIPENGSPFIISNQVSLENIMTATREVERLLKPMTYRDGLLYKHCKDFQDFCKAVKRNSL